MSFEKLYRNQNIQFWVELCPLFLMIYFVFSNTVLPFSAPFNKYFGAKFSFYPENEILIWENRPGLFDVIAAFFYSFMWT